MAPANLTRRRMIAIAAATAGSALLSGGRRRLAQARPVRWRGSALGAQVSIEIFHPDRAEAERLVQRLPGGGAAAGAAVQPVPGGLRDLRPQPERHSGRSGRRHGGAAQGLAAVLPTLPTARSIPPSSRCGSSMPSTSRRKGRIPTVRRPRSWRRRWRKWAAAACASATSASRSLRRGAAITLNGIAQGYATDRVVDVLRARGPVDDPRQHGRDPRDRSESRRARRGASALPIRTSPARSPKPSTSSIARSRPRRAPASASIRRAASRICSIPATGRSPALYRTVSVIAPTATEADALSTAFSLMPLSRIGDIVAARPGVQVRLITSRRRL